MIVKTDSTKDILTIFTDRINQTFEKDGKQEELRGRWCTVCKCVFSLYLLLHVFLLTPSGRADDKYVKAHGLRKCFIVGGNSTARAHIRQYYALYKERCEKDNIPMSPHCMPTALAKEVATAAKDEEANQKQTKISEATGYVPVTKPHEFTWEGVIQAVARHIACHDQVRVISLSVFG